jgi:hypothetical protein
MSADVRIIIVIVVVLIILAFALYLLFNTRRTNTSIIQTRVANGNVIGGLGISCGRGECVTNIYNGSKICPVLESGVLIADPAFEVCNSKFLCDNPITPYALLSDGSTDNNGICQRGVTCRCLRQPQCSSNIVSVFTTSNGTPYQSFAEQRITIAQSLVQSNTNVSTAGTLSPNFQITDPLVNFCTITNSWLKNLSPGICNDIAPNTIAGVVTCQNRNPCIAGTLAFIPDNIEEFTKDQINVTKMACVYGKPCNGNNLTVWDSRINDVVCFPV